jgi:hypothetical protein
MSILAMISICIVVSIEVFIIRISKIITGLCANFERVNEYFEMIVEYFESIEEYFERVYLWKCIEDVKKAHKHPLEMKKATL